MKITIKLSETNNALLNRVVKEEKVDASEFANNAFLDKFLPVSEKLGSLLLSNDDIKHRVLGVFLHEVYKELREQP